MRWDLESCVGSYMCQREERINEGCSGGLESSVSESLFGKNKVESPAHRFLTRQSGTHISGTRSKVDAFWQSAIVKRQKSRSSRCRRPLYLIKSNPQILAVHHARLAQHYAIGLDQGRRHGQGLVVVVGVARRKQTERGIHTGSSTRKMLGRERCLN